MPDDIPELWTIPQIAEYLGVTESSARGALSRWKKGGLVTRYDFQPHPVSGRAQARYPAEEIRAAKAGRPGAGSRTDLTK